MSRPTPDSRPDPETHDPHRPDGIAGPADPTPEDTMDDPTTHSTPGLLTDDRQAEDRDLFGDRDTTDDGSSPATTAPGTGGGATAVAGAEAPRGVRVGTVVWGLVIAAIGVGLIAVASGVLFDVELAFIGLIAAAGIALLVGSVVNATRRSGR
ncbi:MAG: hypothetical protein JWP95_521 [Actinotalea sp.]|nr:hypothetical protein [Actinotalea sp.]